MKAHVLKGHRMRTNLMGANEKRAHATRTTGAAFVLACVLGSLFGCGGVPPMKYYQLATPDSPPVAPTTAVLPVTLVVAPLRAGPLYRDNRLVYATSNTELGTYEFERWAQPPALMIQGVLVRELRASGEFRAVETMGSGSRSNFVLRGNLYDFKEVSNGSVAARVTLDMDLRDTRTGAIVWTHYYTHDQPVTQKDVPSVVAALNQNVQQGVAEISSSLNEYFASHPPQP
jgi:cholesterol transport system auxiliary component